MTFFGHRNVVFLCLISHVQHSVSEPLYVWTNRVIPSCLVKMHKAHRTLFPTCWHIHSLASNCLVPPCARWHRSYHFVHKTSIQQAVMTLRWACTGGSLHVSLLCCIKCCKSSKKHLVTPGNARRLHSGIIQAEDDVSPQVGSDVFMRSFITERSRRYSWISHSASEQNDATPQRQKQKHKTQISMTKRQTYWKSH